MTLRVVPLDSSLDSFGSEVVQELEGLLARARAGEFTSLAIALTTRKGESVTTFTATPEALVRLASVARLMHRLQLACDVNDRNP